MMRHIDDQFAIGLANSGRQDVIMPRYQDRQNCLKTPNIVAVHQHRTIDGNGFTQLTSAFHHRRSPIRHEMQSHRAQQHAHQQAGEAAHDSKSWTQ